MTKQRVKSSEWIGDLLQQVPFVEWDRFTVGEMDGEQFVDVYGWIDRDDEYKDFVWARFWAVWEQVEYTTSSDEYSEQIHINWFGKESLDDHNPCRRVENQFDVDNAVQLTKQKRLTSDGGQSADEGVSD